MGMNSLTNDTKSLLGIIKHIEDFVEKIDVDFLLKIEKNTELFNILSNNFMELVTQLEGIINHLNIRSKEIKPNTMKDFISKSIENMSSASTCVSIGDYMNLLKQQVKVLDTLEKKADLSEFESLIDLLHGSMIVCTNIVDAINKEKEIQSTPGKVTKVLNTNLQGDTIH